jgi:uncharacterized protein YraI
MQIMKKLTIRHLAASVLLMSQSAFAMPNYYAVSGVPENSTITLRAWPSPISKPLLAIPATSPPIEATGKSIMVNNQPWLQINYQERTGWVEAAYLEPTTVAASEPQQATNTAPNYFTPPEAQAPQAQTTQTEIANNAEVFSYGSQPNAPQPSPASATAPEQSENINGYPWSATADTIYDDPNADRRTYQPKPADTVYSALAPASAERIIDLRAENIAGNRYESIEPINQ